MSSNFIDTIAALGKFKVEGSNYTRDEKEWRKSGIDFTSSLSKLMQAPSRQNTTFMDVPIERIRKIKELAKQCNINKVELFPYPNGENVIPLVTVHGGNKELFFHLLGVNAIVPHEISRFASELDSLREAYGVILYESI